MKQEYTLAPCSLKGALKKVEEGRRRGRMHGRAGAVAV